MDRIQNKFEHDKPKSGERACWLCRFFGGPRQGHGSGECHRHAPKPGTFIPGSYQWPPLAEWPNVDSQSWCGDFEILVESHPALVEGRGEKT